MSELPRDTGIECGICGALVAAFEHEMCCHCRTVEWVFPRDSDGTAAAAACEDMPVPKRTAKRGGEANRPTDASLIRKSHQ